MCVLASYKKAYEGWSGWMTGVLIGYQSEADKTSQIRPGPDVKPYGYHISLVLSKCQSKG